MSSNFRHIVRRDQRHSKDSKQFKKLKMDRDHHARRTIIKEVENLNGRIKKEIHEEVEREFLDDFTLQQVHIARELLSEEAKEKRDRVLEIY